MSSAKVQNTQKKSSTSRSEASSVPPSKIKPPVPRTKKKVFDERHIFVAIGSIFSLSMLFVLVLLAGLKSLNLPTIENVTSYKPAQATRIYDRHGNLIDKMFVENRSVVSLSEMPKHLPQAFVAAEDGRFYEHPGLDIISVLRAALNNAWEGRRGQGGSTITQQVAKSLLLTPEKTYIRKIREAILAWRIDKKLSKDEILYIYLNQIYLGEGAHGVEAAANTYFGKRAAELTLGEVALLAGLPQAPSNYSPMRHPERAAARQKYVLNRMAADGYISHKDAKLAYDEKTSLRGERSFFKSENGYYLDVVKAQARSILGQDLQYAGAKIYTNLDQGLQKRASETIERSAVNLEIQNSLQGGNNTPQGGLVCIENNGAKVRALVGGRDYRKSPFNRATQAKRPIGSTVKPFIYAASFEKGWHADSIISDARFSIRGHDGKTWSPKNYSGVFHGNVTLEKALTHSYNAATLRLLQRVGYKTLQVKLKGAGVTSKMQNDLSIALGAVDISLLEMTGAYSLFPRGGSHQSPQLITKLVTSDGSVVYPDRTTRQVYSARATQNMLPMLKSVVVHGSGKKAMDVPGIRGGKTGTSNNNRDVWFIGFTQEYTTGVWFGNDRNQSLGNKVTGGSVAAPAWAKFMSF